MSINPYDDEPGVSRRDLIKHSAAVVGGALVGAGGDDAFAQSAPAIQTGSRSMAGTKFKALVRHADFKTTLQISQEIQQLAVKAREGKLALDDMKGATITITNIGSVGGVYATPIINHPEVAILGVGAIKERPVVVDGEIVARPTVNLSCTFDHRVCDGADAGAFLARLRELIESPEQLILET